jgi:hypothetical protein
VPLKPIARPGDRGGQSRYWFAMVVGVLIVTSYLFIINGVIIRSSYDIWAAFVLAPIFFLTGAAMLRRMLRLVEPDGWIHRVVILGLAAKLAGGFLRFLANEYVFGRGDAEEYHLAGSAIAAELRAFSVGGPAFQEWLPDLVGTRFIRLFTGIVYTVSGPTILGGFIIFSFISFWGLYLFYRAYCIALPDGLRRRYAVLIFFLPSVVFWPSSIGKEAWMTTMLGLGSYGVARLLTLQRFAYPAILAAIAGMGVVRPHVAAIFGAALGAAFILRRTSNAGGVAKKIFGLLLLAAVAGLLINQLQSFFDLNSGLDAQQVFDETAQRSNQGGSQFQSAQPTSPSELPWAIITVLFRPFLFEAGNPGTLVTAVEGTILLALFVWNAPRLARLPALMISRPYVGYALVYTLIFAFAFSAISNFGILARQRTQLFPIAVVVLTVPYQSTLRTRRDIGVEAGEASARSGVEQAPPEATAARPYRRHQALAGRPVGPHHRNQGAQAELGQRQRRPARPKKPPRVRDDGGDRSQPLSPR